jgi:hypothetical protein
MTIDSSFKEVNIWEVRVNLSNLSDEEYLPFSDRFERHGGEFFIEQNPEINWIFQDVEYLAETAIKALFGNLSPKIGLIGLVCIGTLIKSNCP